MRKMKVIIAVLLIVVLLPINMQNASAAESSGNIIHFDDGSYVVIETVIDGRRAANSISAKRTYTYYDTWNNEKWVATLSASFTYNGSTSTCTASSVSINILDSAWYTISQSATKSGNVASCNVVMGRKLLGITTTKKSIDITLTCDTSGNLS